MARNSEYMQARLAKNNTTKISVAQYYMYFLAGYLFLIGTFAAMNYGIIEGAVYFISGAVYIGLGFYSKTEPVKAFQIGMVPTALFSLLYLITFSILALIFFGIGLNRLYSGIQAAKQFEAQNPKFPIDSDILDAEMTREKE